MTANEKFVLAFNKADGTAVEHPIDGNDNGEMFLSIASAIASEYFPAPVKRIALNGASVVKGEDGNLYIEVEPAYPTLDDILRFNGACHSAMEAISELRADSERDSVDVGAYGFKVSRVKQERNRSVRLRIDGTLYESFDVLNGNEEPDADGDYELNSDYVAELIQDYCSDDISDYVRECAEEDVREEYDTIEIGNYSYYPKDVLDAMGDWESYVDDQAEAAYERLADDICSELSRPYDTCSPGPFNSVELVPVYVDEDGDFLEVIPKEDSDESSEQEAD